MIAEMTIAELNNWFADNAKLGIPFDAHIFVTINDLTQKDTVIKSAAKHGIILIPITDHQYRCIAHVRSIYIDNPNDWTIKTMHTRDGYIWLLTKDGRYFFVSPSVYDTPAAAEQGAMAALARNYHD